MELQRSVPSNTNTFMKILSLKIVLRTSIKLKRIYYFENTSISFQDDQEVDGGLPYTNGFLDGYSEKILGRSQKSVR